MTTSPLDPSWRPSHGGLRHQFAFDPLHYGAGGKAQAEFKRRMREEVRKYGFIFTGEVEVIWTLFVDEQARWESDTGADVDNFAKLLNDGLCGPDGLLIDDVQIQSLNIHWEGAFGESRFELTVHCNPDEWVVRNCALYELGNRMWYPLPRPDGWSSPSIAGSFIRHLDGMVTFVKDLRHALRQAGLTSAQSYAESLPFTTLARGFHATRAAASGIVRVGRAEWLHELPAGDHDLGIPMDPADTAKGIMARRRALSPPKTGRPPASSTSPDMSSGARSSTGRP